MAAFLIFGLQVSAFAQGTIVVHVESEVSITSDRVVLGSIARILETSDHAERLRRISLGYAPKVGAIRQIGCDRIALSIRAAGFGEKDVSIECSSSAVVRRSGQAVTSAMIREAVTASLAKNFPDQDVEAKLARLDIPADLMVPTGEVELTADWSGIRNIFAPFSLPVRVRIDGKKYRTLTVNAEVEAFADVLVAAADLAANTNLMENDVRIERVRLSQPISSYLRTPRQIAGTMLTREVRMGGTLTSDVLAAVSVVKYGDTVRIEAISGSMKLIVAGEARAAGRIGDRIAVKNIQSGAILQAVVVDRGRVRISL